MGEQNKEETRAKKRRKYSQSVPEGLRVIPAKEVVDFFHDTSEKNVGFYARVSTDSLDQLSSYTMQCKLYTEMVERHEGWNLVQIYADEGKSGTTTKHRDGFNQMMRDAYAGKLDLIVTKSVSRFSRNILDTIESVRRLASLKPPVGVYFENDGLYTLSSDSEMRLSFSASVAQEESRIKSVAMNSSIDVRFSHGIFLTPPLLGYDNDEDGALVINEAEADTVRMIFFLYLCGFSTERIAQALAQQQRRTKKGSTDWHAASINAILRNERYCGDVLARKTYTPDYKDHKSVRNRQDRKQYYLEDVHEAIIMRDDFIAVQRKLDNAKYGCQRFLPELHVVSGGALHGFVTVSPHWAAFTPEDYAAASERAGAPPSAPPRVLAKRGMVDLHGFAVAHAAEFSLFGSCYITLMNAKMRSNSLCRKKLQSDYIELLVHPKKKQLALRPCGKGQRNALRLRSCGAGAFYGTLCAVLGWEPEQPHKLPAALCRAGKGIFLLADAQVRRESFYVHQAKQAQTISLGKTISVNIYDELRLTEPALVEKQLREMGACLD